MSGHWDDTLLDGNQCQPTWMHPTMSFQRVTLESSFLYKFTKSVSFYNAKPILTKPNALLAIKFPGSQWALLHRYL
ncbi:hypothetical protein [Wolbachia endosymbiont (group A) of Pogonocherus hispidulus]|uniref:hypothetical protein n=1 Tax=Wolbachia endosymbiont (group A) of Pogonocherus hispidulus TaxID=3066136 RepID=UPI003341F1C2